MQLDLFENNEALDSTGRMKLEDLFEAYFSCRSNKRNTANALAFEVDYERNLIQLCEAINNGSYEIGRSIAFIVNKPVTREIFAADFRDRVVHHWLINKLNPLFEKEFIYDSYACRVNKGTHFGIRRAYGFIASCSNNYGTDCHILKLDIQGFFMRINREMLFQRLRNFINEKYHEPDKELVTALCGKFVFNDPARNCIIKGRKRDWDGLPKNKSLFHSPPGCGLPIGNLTSQVFANCYLNAFDHFVKKDLGIRYYGRYVDDVMIVHPEKDFLKSLLPELSDYLQTNLYLTLHPKKIYLQHYTKGVKFLGTMMKPGRIYIGNRTKGNFYSALQKQNEVVRNSKPDKVAQHTFLSSINSYLGIMKHYKTYNLRKRTLLKNVSGWWWNYVYIAGGMVKVSLKIKPAKSIAVFLLAQPVIKARTIYAGKKIY